jgi:hypothetical protein
MADDDYNGDKLYDLIHDWGNDLEFRISKELITKIVVRMQRTYRNYKVYRAYITRKSLRGRFPNEVGENIFTLLQ